MDQLRSFFLFEEITHTLALFSLAIATPAWGVAEFANLNTQLKKVSCTCHPSIRPLTRSFLGHGGAAGGEYQGHV